MKLCSVTEIAPIFNLFHKKMCFLLVRKGIVFHLTRPMLTHPSSICILQNIDFFSYFLLAQETQPTFCSLTIVLLLVTGDENWSHHYN